MADGEGSADIILAESGQVVARPRGLIGSLPPEARERVRGYGIHADYGRGEQVFRQGDPHDGIVVIESGMVRSYYTAPSGREITLAYWQPGNFVGGPEIFGGGTHMWSAVAVRPTGVIRLPGEGLRDLARDVPDLALAIIDALVFKARCYSSLAQMLGTRSLRQRLAQVLIHLAQNYGMEEEGEVAVAAAFTHSEIANLIGATRQWVTISLNRMQKAGILHQNRGILVIRRLDLLTQESSQDED